MDAIFRVAGDCVITGPNAAGPWDLSMQHGSAPSSLVTYLAEAMPTAVPMQVTRVTVELMRPVPVALLTFATRVVREGRNIQLCAVELFADGKMVVTGHVLKTRLASIDGVPAEARGAPLALPAPNDCRLLDDRRFNNPFLTSWTMRSAVGDFATPGPGAIWFRLNREIVEGQSVSQAVRAVATADFGNGVSSQLDFRTHTFLNADLTVSLIRQPVGDWILLDAESWIGESGAGLAAGRLADVGGYFGRVAQSLVVAKR